MSWFNNFPQFQLRKLKNKDVKKKKLTWGYIASKCQNQHLNANNLNSKFLLLTILLNWLTKLKKSTLVLILLSFQLIIVLKKNLLVVIEAHDLEGENETTS